MQTREGWVDNFPETYNELQIPFAFLRDDRWRGLLSIYINFKVVVHSEGNSWPLVSPTEFFSVIACKVSTFGSLYTCAFRPWHHNSVPAHISLHSGLFKLTLIHRCTVRPGTLIWKSGSSFRRLSPLHWHCNSIQFRESLVLSKDRIEFHQTFRNQAAIKQCPKQTVRHIHTRKKMLLQTLLEASYQWDLWYCGLSAIDPSLSPARRFDNIRLAQKSRYWVLEVLI